MTYEPFQLMQASNCPTPLSPTLPPFTFLRSPLATAIISPPADSSHRPDVPALAPTPPNIEPAASYRTPSSQEKPVTIAVDPPSNDARPSRSERKRGPEPAPVVMVPASIIVKLPLPTRSQPLRSRPLANRTTAADQLTVSAASTNRPKDRNRTKSPVNPIGEPRRAPTESNEPPRRSDPRTPSKRRRSISPTGRSDTAPSSSRPRSKGRDLSQSDVPPERSVPRSSSSHRKPSVERSRPSQRHTSADSEVQRSPPHRDRSLTRPLPAASIPTASRSTTKSTVDTPTPSATVTSRFGVLPTETPRSSHRSRSPVRRTQTPSERTTSRRPESSGRRITKDTGEDKDRDRPRDSGRDREREHASHNSDWDTDQPQRRDRSSVERSQSREATLTRRTGASKLEKAIANHASPVLEATRHPSTTTTANARGPEPITQKSRSNSHSATAVPSPDTPQKSAPVRFSIQAYQRQRHSGTGEGAPPTSLATETAPGPLTPDNSRPLAGSQTRATPQPGRHARLTSNDLIEWGRRYKRAGHTNLASRNPEQLTLGIVQILRANLIFLMQYHELGDHRATQDTFNVLSTALQFAKWVSGQCKAHRLTTLFGLAQQIEAVFQHRLGLLHFKQLDGEIRQAAVQNGPRPSSTVLSPPSIDSLAESSAKGTHNLREAEKCWRDGSEEFSLHTLMSKFPNTWSLCQGSSPSGDTRLPTTGFTSARAAVDSIVGSSSVHWPVSVISPIPNFIGFLDCVLFEYAYQHKINYRLER